MELSFPLLAVLVLVLSGWPAGFYLLFQWLRHRKDADIATSPWGILCITGWILAAVGWLSKVLADNIVFLVTFLSPLLWLIALFLFRKWAHENKQTLTPEYGEKQEGVWPPPPNVPK